MPASVKLTAETYNIIGGRGAVTLAEALVAAGGAAGFVKYAKGIKLWGRLNTTEQTELEMLDEQMPEGFWRRMKHAVVASASLGHAPAYDKGEWDIRETAGGATVVVTPALNPETGELEV